MCDNCKDNVQPDTNELTSELSETLTSPPSDSDVVLFFEPLELGMDNLAEDSNIQLNNNEFVRGIKDASYACGMYTALLNCAWSMEDAVAYIFNFMNVNHNIEVAKINAESSIEVSKNASILKEKELL